MSWNINFLWADNSDVEDYRGVFKSRFIRVPNDGEKRVAISEREFDDAFNRACGHRLMMKKIIFGEQVK